MLPKTAANSPGGLRPEQVLSSLLSPEQLTELATLISSITKVMHKRIADAFDPTADGGSRHGHRRPGERLEKNARNPNIDERISSNQEETVEEARDRKLGARRERDLPEPKLRDLKNDALDDFQVWRDSIVTKIVDALNAKDGQRGLNEDIVGSTTDEAPPPDSKILGKPLLRERAPLSPILTSDPPPND